MESNDKLEETGRIFVLKVGKAGSCDLVINDNRVSDFHCSLIVENDDLMIKDICNEDPIYVNGVRVKYKTITVKDEIYLGVYPFKLADYMPILLDQHALTRSKYKKAQIVIGRYEKADFVLCYPQVSNIHAIVFRENDKWFIEDLGSTNGTFVNDRNLRIRKKEINKDSQLYFGSYGIAAFRIIQSGKEKTTYGTHVTGDVIQIGEPLIIGRDPACDFPLGSPTISWHHAKLQKVGTHYELEDTGSTNGTFVNGERIRHRTISVNDVIAIGSFYFGIDENGRIVKRDFRGDIRLDVEDVTVMGKEGPILDRITFTVYPGEFVGLMGPSGAGKTTLLTAINGYRLPHCGVVKLNGQDLYSNFNNFRRVIGYVPQDDIIHGELTVYEALRYTARLRFSKDVSDAEIDDRINQVLSSLALSDSKFKQKMIGTPEKRGISGGERKRVNLAMELLTDPSLLFLDEPTSGLSSGDTVTVMNVIQKLAREGKTIILTIHQPSLEVYKKMNNVIILKSGILGYFGPAFPDAMTFFNPEKPKAEAACCVENVLDGLNVWDGTGTELEKKKAAQAWHGIYMKSDYYRDYVRGRRESEIKLDGKELTKGNKIVSQPFRQWWILLQRYLTLKRRDLIGLTILLSQAPIIAALIANVFHNDKEVIIPLYFLVIAALWFGTSNAAKEIVCEKAVYTRERMVNLRIIPYIMSKFMGLSLLCFIQCLVMVLIFDAFLDIKADPVRLFGLTVLASLVGLSVGLSLSALVKTTEAAIALVPLVLLPMIILGGLISPIADMNPSTR